MDRIQDGFISDCIGPIFTPTEPTPEAEPPFFFFLSRFPAPGSHERQEFIGSVVSPTTGFRKMLSPTL
jgi:hypothetical protein